MKRFCLALLAAVLAAPSQAQYEDLLKQPEPEPIAVPDTPAVVVPPPPQPRLLPPTLHTDRIAQLDQSADGLHLLTADARTLRVWDVAHRAAIATYQAPSPRPIEFAAFTSQPRQIFLIADGKGTLHDDFDFSTAVQTYYLRPAQGIAFHRSTNTVVHASVDSQGIALNVYLFDPSRARSARELRIPLIKTFGSDAKLSVPPGNNLTLDDSGRFAAFRFANRLPMVVIDLEAGSLLATVPHNLKPAVSSLRAKSSPSASPTKSITSKPSTRSTS